MDEENQKLRRQNARLTEDLRKAHIIIDVQKKWLRCWSSDFGAGPGGKVLMAAVTELASDVGTRAACRALFAPRASYYRDRRAACFPQRSLCDRDQHVH